MNTSAGPLQTQRFREIVDQYIQHWRTLGRLYQHQAWVLGRLCDFMEASNQSDLDQACFEAWCESWKHTTPTTRRNAQLVVRKLCLYRRRTEPSCFVPDSLYFTRRAPYQIPLIIGPDQIERLFKVISNLPALPFFLLRNAVIRVSFVLLYTAGLRRAELLRLTLADFDPERGILAIRESKYHKTRFLPLSTDALTEMEAYLRLRQVAGADQGPDAPLLGHYTLAGKFTGYEGSGLYQLLTKTIKSAEITDAQGRRPRIHDFRHTFAVQALLRWYREGADVQAQLPKLSLYMGHVSIMSTAYYLHWIPDIAIAASHLFERQCGQLATGGVS